MCSIFGVLDIKTDAGELRKKALELSRLMRHRGPDWSGVYASDKAILAHERLSIVDVNAGAQPLYNAEKTHALAVNGEIYNHRELRRELRRLRRRAHRAEPALPHGRLCPQPRAGPSARSDGRGGGDLADPGLLSRAV